MGIILKESFRQSVVRISLSVIGAIATIFIYPLDRELYGIFGFVIDSSVLFMPLVIVGLGSASIRFFPYHNSDLKSRTRFLVFLFKLLLLNALLTAVLFFLFKNYLISFSRNPSSDFSLYLNYLLPGTILFGFNQFLFQYISNYKELTIPVIWQNMYKIMTPVIFLIVLFGSASTLQGLQILIAILLISALVLLATSIYKRKQTTLSPFTESKEQISNNRFFQYYFWAFASSLGALMAFKIDGFMVSTMTDFTSNGDYRIAVFMASVIAIPIQSVVAISSPIISQAWKDQDIKSLSEVYLKGSRNLLFIGGLMLIALLILIQLLPYIVPSWQQLEQIKSLVIIIGLAKLFDMFSSVNGVIIQQSSWFRYNTYFILILSVSNIVLNYFLINEYGILGAAIATAISLALFNLLKCLFLYRKIKLQPYKLDAIIYYVSVAIFIIALVQLHDRVDWLWFLIISISSFSLFAVFWLFFINFAPDTKSALLSIRNKFK